MSPRIALLALCAVGFACSHPARPLPPSSRSSEMQVGLIPPTPVAGDLDGRRFVVRDAWYRVQRKAGRERIDLTLSEGRVTRLCAESDPEASRHVWLRFPQWQRFSAGEYRIDPGRTPVFTAHYEAPDGRPWKGTSEASAVLVLSPQEGDTVEGRIELCFADPTRSCVHGTFRARECRSELDPDGPSAGNLAHPPADGGPTP